PPGDSRRRRGDRSRPVADGRLDPAGCDDPGRRRRSGHRPGGGHQGVPAVHPGVLSRRGAGGLRRRDGGALPLGLSRIGFRDAAAGAHRRDPGRHRQPAGRAGGQLPDRLPVQFRPGDVSRPRLRDPVPADAAGARAAATGPVRPGRGMREATVRYVALAVALLGLVSLPAWIGNAYYINISSQVLLFAVFALALNVLVGYGGLVSLGHAGLFAIAAYAG